jgi:hypothetical protein
MSSAKSFEVHPIFSANLCTPYHGHEYSGRILMGSDFIVFGAFPFLQKKSYGFVISVSLSFRPFVRMEQLGSY